jgi:hypothetical protein
MWWVAAVSGADMNTTLAWGSTSRSMSGGTIRSTAADGGMSFGSTPMTRSPNAAARSAMADPAPPTPITTAVFPLSSIGVYPVGFHRLRARSGMMRCSRRVSASSIAMA